MPPTLERPLRRERRVEWRNNNCLVGRQEQFQWEAIPSRRRTRHGSPRRAWLAMNPYAAVRLSAPSTAGVEELFGELAAQWENETVFESVVTRKAMHPAYQRIIGIGAPAVPLILARLRDEPAHWFWALTAITGADPAGGETTVEGAAKAWLAWGRARGLVSN